MILAVFKNFCYFKVLLGPKAKTPKTDCFDRGKIEEKSYFFKDSTTYFKYHIYHSYCMNFMILLVGFVVCNVLGHFYRFNDFHFFQYCENCVSLVNL